MAVWTAQLAAPGIPLRVTAPVDGQGARDRAAVAGVPSYPAPRYPRPADQLGSDRKLGLTWVTLGGVTFNRRDVIDGYSLPAVEPPFSWYCLSDGSVTAEGSREPKLSHPASQAWVTTEGTRASRY